MRQLASIDAQFLAIEDGRTHGHVAAVGIYDPSTAPAGQLTHGAVRDLVAARLHLLPPFHWRLVEVPFGLDHPYWHHESEFDLDFHIRELALPAPGDAGMLAEQVARIAARPLDRARPLWELYLIHGFDGDRVAVLTKVHHAAVDGMSGAEILSVLLDRSPEGRTLPAPTATPVGRNEPGQLEMLARGLAAIPQQRVRSLRGLPRALPHLDQHPTMRTLPGISAVAALSRRASRLRPRTNRRRRRRRPRSTRPAHLPQRADRPAPAGRLHPAITRRGQADQEPLRRHRQRRRRSDLCRRAADLAAGPRRAARGTAARHDPRLAAHRD